jgi:hypothetical protein
MASLAVTEHVVLKIISDGTDNVVAEGVLKLDGSSGTVAGLNDISYAGLGLNLRRPDWMQWTIDGTLADDLTDTGRPTAMFIDAYDDANSNFDVTVQLSDALGSDTADSVFIRYRIYWKQGAPSAGISGPMSGYTAAANTSI